MRIPSLSKPIEMWGQLSRAWQSRLFWFAAIGVVGILLLIATSREFATFGTETDFIQLFLPEATRILNGEALEIRFHPPGYPVILALPLSLFANALTAGIAISLVSTCVAAWLNYKLYKALLGEAYGVAALIGFLVATPILLFSVLATTDAYFFAMFSAIVFLSLSVSRNASALGSAAAVGALIGIALLTRSNALTLLVCILSPFVLLTSFHRDVLRPRLLQVAMIALAAAIPNLIWYLVATLNGMPVSPGGTVENLAMTYFSSGNRISGESMEQIAGQFDSVFAVLLHDPIHIITQYCRDLAALPFKFAKATHPLMVISAIPGIALLLWRRERLFLFYVIAIIGLQISLINLKTFEARYYLFLYPLLAVGAFETARLIYARINNSLGQWLLFGAIGIFVAYTSVQSVLTTHSRVHENAGELANVIDATEGIDFDQYVWVGRKIQLSYHLDVEYAFFRSAQSFEDLKSKIDSIETPKSILFYYGSSERRHWHGIAALRDPSNYPNWLVPVAQGDASGGWVLFQYTPAES